MSDYPFLFELLLFAGKALIFVIAAAVILLLIILFCTARRGLKNSLEAESGSEVVLINLTRRQQTVRKAMQRSLKKQDPDEKIKRLEVASAEKKGLFPFLSRGKKKAKQGAGANQGAENTEAAPAQDKKCGFLQAAAAGKKGLFSCLNFLHIGKKKVKSAAGNAPAGSAEQQKEPQAAAAAQAAAESAGDAAASVSSSSTVEAASYAAADSAAAVSAETSTTSAAAEPQQDAAAAPKDAAKADCSKDKEDKARRRLDKKKNKRQEHLAAVAKLREEGKFCPRNVFVINFHGSSSGAEVKKLTVMIDALLQCADERDEAVIRLSSPGGLVNSYGLLSSQLMRIRSRGIFLTVCVDTVAASGGYLMACVANKIVAAPFAYIGSIGVVAGIPNFHRLMQRHEVDYEQVTAGKYKRTLTMLGENTEEGRAKFKAELEAIHVRFKEQVQRFRPQLDIDKVATGEAWLGLDALELGLIDEIGVFEDYINKLQQRTENNVLQLIVKKKPKGLKGRLRRLLGPKGLGRMLHSSALEQVQALDDPHAHIR